MRINIRKSLQKSKFTIGVPEPLEFAAGFTHSVSIASEYIVVQNEMFLGKKDFIQAFKQTLISMD
ncbi:hypothetical protein LXL04_005638 [Taraxacum kok-saghyz]